MKKTVFILILLQSLALPMIASAHHVMGRPSYSLNEDSNTPPSMQVETRIGDYFVTYMIFPAFPRPGQVGRINLYASTIDNGQPFQGTVRFSVRDDSWFQSKEEIIGDQPVDDNVFRQGFVFSKEGDYIISASFNANGQPYHIDFPLRIGQPSRVGVIGVAVTLIFVLLIGVNIAQRRRVNRAKMRQTQRP
ncbi:MAG: hypothetical protein Q9M31_05350 [Mariprofundus sp.]|nr:hypothetical protein [Mariprofundus sp.]